MRDLTQTGRRERRPRAMRRLAVVGAAAGVLIVVAAASATPNYDPPRAIQAPPADRQAKSDWGERTASAETDCDGDGAIDVYVAAPFLNGNQGRVYLMSGRSLTTATPMVIATYDSPQPQADARFGFFISVLDDNPASTADKPNIAIGTDAQDVGGHVDQGKAWVFAGCGDSPGKLFDLDNPYPQGSANNRARFGSRLGRAGDLTGDGKTEVIAGASGNDVPAQSAPGGTPGCGDAAVVAPPCRKDQGQAFIFDGATGTLIRQLDFPVEDHQPQGNCQTGCGQFGIAVQGPGDTDGDGKTDQLVDAIDYSKGAAVRTGRMYVFKGGSTTGPCQFPKAGLQCESVRLKIDDPVPQEAAFFGFQDVTPLSPGDVNADGKADLYGHGFLQTDTLPSSGQAWVFDGLTGTKLYDLHDPTPTIGGQFGFAMTKTTYKPTAASTAVDALYIGEAPHFIPGTDQNGSTELFKRSDGTLLEQLPLPVACRQKNGTSLNIGPTLGWTVSAPGDLDADGLPDYVAGAPHMDTANQQDRGLVFAFHSKADGPASPCPPGGTGDEALP